MVVRLTQKRRKPLGRNDGAPTPDLYQILRAYAQEANFNRRNNASKNTRTR